MVSSAKEMRQIQTIRIVIARPYQRNRRVFTIGRIPWKSQGFFEPPPEHFAGPAWKHFRGLVMAIAVGHHSAIERLGKLFHHATGKYGTGHTILKACLWYREVTIPWGSRPWIKPVDAPKENIPFAKLTQLAASGHQRPVIRRLEKLLAA